MVQINLNVSLLRRIWHLNSSLKRVQTLVCKVLTEMVNRSNNYEALKKENDELKSQIGALTKEIEDWKALVDNHLCFDTIERRGKQH